MDKMEIYNLSRVVPEEAKKAISGGRLKGKTDINPMWRLKRLTELFGPCGIGWRYTLDRQWLEHGYKEEIAAFCNITLYVKQEDLWSEGIPGTGGSAFVAEEKSGPYTSDECYKMALTDALSVACKALGIGADVYWDKDASKYPTAPPAPAPVPPHSLTCDVCGGPITAMRFKGEELTAQQVADRFGKCIGCLKAGKG